MQSGTSANNPTGFIMIDTHGDGLRIGHNDPKSWLTLFYQLPREILDKRKEYYEIPRCPYDVLRTDRYDVLIDDDKFLELVWDSYAWAIWQCFQVPNDDGTYHGIPGLDRFYSGDFPLWRLSYYCVGLMRGFFERNGLGFQELYNIPSGVDIPFLTYQLWGNLIGNALDQIIEEQKLQPVIDETWRNRTLEDYSEYYSKVKAAFEAQWYHRKTKVGRNMVSLEKLMEPENEQDPLKEIVASTEDFSENLIDQLRLEAFYSSLSDRDRQILELKLEGFTDQEIAEKVGYKTHSAVVKRVKTIRDSFDTFIKAEYAAYQETFAS